ncbi:MAG: thioredoxin [Planctomycetota bacterium]
MANVPELQDSNLETTLQSAERPVLVDFSATWCGPCKALAPKIDTVASDYDGKLDVYKVDIDQAQEAAVRFGISGVPTCIFFSNGVEVDRFVGNKDLKQIKSSVEKVLEN